MEEIPGNETETIIIQRGHGEEHLLVASDITAKQALLKICDRLEIDHNDPHCRILALWASCSNLQLRLQLTPDHRLSEIKKKMSKMSQNGTDQSAIEFKLGRNGFYQIDDEKNIDNIKLLKFLYCEAKINCENNVYPLSFSQIIELGLIENKINLLAEKNKNEVDNKLSSDKTIEKNEDDNKSISDKTIEKNEDDDTVKKICKSLSYKNSFRRQMLKYKIMKCAKMQKQNNIEEDEKSLYVKYLEICRSQVSYGGFLFTGQMERTLKEGIIHLQYYDKKVYIAINENGLHVVNIDCPKVLFTTSYSELYYGIFKPKKDDHHPCLFVKSKSSLKVNKIFTRQASFIDKVLPKFIEDYKSQPITEINQPVNKYPSIEQDSVLPESTAPSGLPELSVVS